MMLEQAVAAEEQQVRATEEPNDCPPIHYMRIPPIPYHRCSRTHDRRNTLREIIQ
jgi:hypothetical protein